MEEMICEMYSSNADKMDMLAKLLHVYLFKVRRVYLQYVGNLPETMRASQAFFNLFRQSIDKSLFRLSMSSGSEIWLHPTVSSLAEDLSVTANYLNSVVKKLTGRTASSYIQEKLMLEAKSLLIHTPLQVAEISSRLGYQSASYFTRFFKKASGYSPIDFRRKFTAEK